MARALTEASKRGVRVVLLLPGAIDNHIVRHASRARLGELFEAGIEIYEYQAGLPDRSGSSALSASVLESCKQSPLRTL
jgi:phosphatidylserine/phosphatidylglycerophosphate/cardiolipin synthase-like enzyme